MEAIIAIVVIWFGWAIISSLLSAGVNTTKSVIRKAQGKPDPYFGPVEVDIANEVIEETGSDFKSIKIRGIVPVAERSSVTISTHFLDVTDSESWHPLISYIEDVQEEETICFQQKQEGIALDPGDCFTDWVQCAVMIPSLLQAPYKGQRKIAVVVAAYSEDNPAELHGGFYDDTDKLIFVNRTDFDLSFEDTGYLEERENSDESRLLSIEIAVAVAMADGALDDSEGEVIKHWMAKNIEFYSGSKQQEMRERFNSTLRDAYSDAAKGVLLVSPLCQRLSEIGDTKSRFDTIELCMDVMAADGVADPEELKTIRSIAEIIEFDLSEMERMKEERLVSTNLLSSNEDSYHILGIEESWSKREKLKHVRSEFQKWNNRLTSLSEGDERENAQRMLDLIATVKGDIEKSST